MSLLLFQDPVADPNAKREPNKGILVGATTGGTSANRSEASHGSLTRVSNQIRGRGLDT